MSKKTGLKRDYEAALEFGNIKLSDPDALQRVWQWVLIYGLTIHHALSEMARMQKGGMVMVPREPTESQISEICSVYCDSDDTGSTNTAREAYKAMIAASQEKKDE